jgi:hypothetical protein
VREKESEGRRRVRGEGEMKRANLKVSGKAK